MTGVECRKARGWNQATLCRDGRWDPGDQGCCGRHAVTSLQGGTHRVQDPYVYDQLMFTKVPR